MVYNNTNENPLAAGLTAAQLVNLLDGNEAEFAASSLNYLDGKQEQELIKILNDPEKGRKDWARRGFIPRYRNLTAMIVEKSGMLFKDAVPLLEVRQPNSDKVDQNASETLTNLLDQTEFQEVMINLDTVVRLLKTALLLIQWDDVNQKIVFDILHRANCNVIIDPLTKQIAVLIQRTGQSGKQQNYRVWTQELIYDLVETEKSVSVIAETPNTYNCIPAAVFYDTKTPRAGFWVEAARDLKNLNEQYNIHLTDNEYVTSWLKRPSLFTNCSLDGYSDESLEVVQVPGSVLPRAISRSPSITGGPDVAIVVGSSNGESPFVKYEAPKVDLKPLDDIMQGLVKTVAADWSVRVRADGDGSATSGFQLVVEELPNLELRQTRARMFEAGFKRMYRVIAAVSNGQLPSGAELFAVFQQPNLPVNPIDEENVWDLRINSGRATILDYFCAVQGLSKDEATAKWIEVTEWRMAAAKIESALMTEVNKEVNAAVSEEDAIEGDSRTE